MNFFGPGRGPARGTAELASMDTILSMRVFRQVVESGGFTAASVALEMSVAMVSKHIKHLEEHLSTRLLNRTSRKVSLNTPGAAYYERCCEILNQIDDAEALLKTELKSPKGVLRITAPTWFSNRFFARILSEYSQRCPEVLLDVSLSDATVDLVEEGLDLALRGTLNEQADAKLPFEVITKMEFVIVASPQYLERCGRPESWDDLARHHVLTYSYAPSNLFPQSGRNWRLNSTALIGELAAQGVGIAVLPKFLIEEESYQSQLEIILGNLDFPNPTLYAVTHQRRHQSARIRSFVEFLRERFLAGCPASSID